MPSWCHGAVNIMGLTVDDDSFADSVGIQI